MMIQAFALVDSYNLYLSFKNGKSQFCSKINATLFPSKKKAKHLLWKHNRTKRCFRSFKPFLIEVTEKEYEERNFTKIQR